MTTQTFSFSGPNVKPYQQFMGRSKTIYVATANGLFDGVSLQDQPDFIAAGFTPSQESDIYSNVSATLDPTSSNDQTQGYSAGSIWVNTSNGRAWICVSAATGAATWALSVVPGVGVEPSTNLEQFGSGTGNMLAEGNLYRAVYSAASAISPATTGADVVLSVYSLPANSLDGISNRGLSITAMGLFAANSHNKECKIIFNPTTAVVGSTVGTGGTNIADTSLSTASGVGWELTANVFKFGVPNSNTQYAQESGSIVGPSHGGIGVPVYPTATENAAILIAVTGNAATTTTDITLNFVEINAMN